MPSKSDQSLANLAFDSWMLGFEAASVMWLRGFRLMAGGKLAQREAERMISEKVVANAMLLPFLALGGFDQTPGQLGARTLSHYAKPVRANRRRLSR